MWTSRAPASKTRRIRSRSCVPRTIESSQNRSRLPSMISRMGISFMRATRSRTRLLLRHEGAGPGRRVLDERPPVGDAGLGGVADRRADPGVGDARRRGRGASRPPRERRAAPVARDLRVDALVVRRRVAVVDPQERADLHAIPGGDEGLAAVGGDPHDLARARGGGPPRTRGSAARTSPSSRPRRRPSGRA